MRLAFYLFKVKVVIHKSKKLVSSGVRDEWRVADTMAWHEFDSRNQSHEYEWALSGPIFGPLACVGRTIIQIQIQVARPKRPLSLTHNAKRANKTMGLGTCRCGMAAIEASEWIFLSLFLLWHGNVSAPLFSLMFSPRYGTVNNWANRHFAVFFAVAKRRPQIWLWATLFCQITLSKQKSLSASQWHWPGARDSMRMRCCETIWLELNHLDQKFRIPGMIKAQNGSNNQPNHSTALFGIQLATLQLQMAGLGLAADALEQCSLSKRRLGDISKLNRRP